MDQSLPARWQFVRLSALATDIRLRTPEAFEVHRRVIDWQRAHSPQGIPARATGLWHCSLPLMHWAMDRWTRMSLLNRCGGTLAAALQMDYVPGLASSAYFMVRFQDQVTPANVEPERLLAAGRSMQRFWLTATRLGLGMQPALALLIFADYGAESAAFTANHGLLQRAQSLAARFQQRLKVAPHQVIFIGRIGESHPRLPLYRSTRLPLAQLMQVDTMD